MTWKFASMLHLTELNCLEYGFVFVSVSTMEQKCTSDKDDGEALGSSSCLKNSQMLLPPSHPHPHPTPPPFSPPAHPHQCKMFIECIFLLEVHNKLLLEIWVAFPDDSQLWQSHATQPKSTPEVVHNLSQFSLILGGGGGGGGGVARSVLWESEFKSEDPGFDPLTGARVRSGFSVPPSQLLCRLVCAWATFMCTARTQIWHTLKIPYYIHLS